MLLHSNNELLNSFRNFIEEQQKLIIFSPYIKLSALQKMLDGFESSILTIVTTWKPMDIAIGVTDLDIYNFCYEYNIQLLINNRIHLKCLIDSDFTSCIVSSSNITNRGLALASSYNYELGTTVTSLSTSDRCYFDTIFDTSTIVTQDYYEDILKQVSVISNSIDEVPIEFESSENIQSLFLTSELPYFDRPENLHDVVVNQELYSDEDVRSAFHDIRLYKIDSSIDKQHLKSVLKINFISNPFIKSFLEFNGTGKYFGELTSWLHDKLENVPSPKRFEVKEYQKRIYAYIDILLKDEYKIEVPMQHSQFLRKIG